MKHRIAFLFVAAFATVIGVTAQSRTVTNIELDKYRQQRINADREYRDNYERLGLPSPEEIADRNEQRRAQSEDLANRLRNERLEQEARDAQREDNDHRMRSYYRNDEHPSSDRGPIYDADRILYYNNGFGSYYYSGDNFRYSRRRNGRFNSNNQYQQPGYAAGGQFWNSGPRTAPQPLIVRPRR